MPTVRIVITLKPGILDAQGQAVQDGLHALEFARISQVRVGRYIELTVSEHISPAAIHQMCDRFLANPLIEDWRFDTDATSDPGSAPRIPIPASPRTGETG